MMKHIIAYWAKTNGNTYEEGQELWEDRKKRTNANLFKPISYEKYLWQKENNKLKGEY